MTFPSSTLYPSKNKEKKDKIVRQSHKKIRDYYYVLCIFTFINSLNLSFYNKNLNLLRQQAFVITLITCSLGVKTKM